MNEDINLLIKKFQEIEGKGWIRSISKSFGSIGLTFEKELGKKADSLYFPDYFGIELKCTSNKSKYPLYLFTLAFDGPNFPEIDRIIKKYGYSDKDYPEYKVLATNLSYKYKTTIKSGVKFKLHINEEEEKLYLNVYDLSNNMIESESFVYLDSIKQHLLLKLNQLALVYAESKKDEISTYFHYYKMAIYQLKSFEDFIELLKRDIIKVSLIARIEKSGNEIGRYRNKNLVFQINKEYINKLFKQVDLQEFEQYKK